MKNIAVINGTGLRAPAFRPLLDGASSFERALSFARELPNVGEKVLFLSRPLEDTQGCRTIVRESWTIADLMSELAGASEGMDDVFYFFADCPFLDIEITRRMHASHRRYYADYTFADGYPYGLTPEIFTRDTVGRLRGLAGEGRGAPDRETIFTLVKKDINSFDIETEISPTDMRMLRVSLCADLERNFLLLRRIVNSGGRNAESACGLLVEKPGILRTLPAFFPIQIVEQCPHACAYCPYPVFGGDILSKTGFMPMESFSSLLGKIVSFAGEAVIDVSLWGEPALHPRIYDMVAATLEHPGLDLVIETSGVGWQPGVFSKISTTLSRSPTWIVSLDATNEGLYRSLRGSGFAEAHRAAEELIALFPAHAWVQAVRMKENEDDLEKFFKSWKTRTENVIVQKYDSFSGLLPDRKVADLSPVRRFPCWHLKRDMVVLLDGTVPLCKEDVRTGTRLGNALEEDLELIWDRAQPIYRSHMAESYPGVCAACDEYYTYNF